MTQNLRVIRTERLKLNSLAFFCSILNNLSFTRHIFSTWEKTVSMTLTIGRSLSQHQCVFCPVFFAEKENCRRGATAEDPMLAERRRFIHAATSLTDYQSKRLSISHVYDLIRFKNRWWLNSLLLVSTFWYSIFFQLLIIRMVYHVSVRDFFSLF